MFEQDLLYSFNSVLIAVALFEVTARVGEFENGDRLGTRSIVRYGDTYNRRQTLAER